MLFNSFSFLIFFTILVVVYYLLPHRFRWGLLLVASVYFYATFNVNYVLLLLAAALLAYAVGVAMGAVTQAGRKKALLVVGMLASLAPLIVYKYFDFFAASLDSVLQHAGGAFSTRLGLLLPAGLSFFTFSCVSYLIDVYRGKLPPERHPGRMVLYVAFFPKLLAGPIERATSFLPQLLRPIHFDPDDVAAGLQLMVWGLFKKVVIADRLGTFVDSAYLHPAFSSPVALLIATYFFAFQIYCDFSGYSDIAIGAAQVLGIHLMENFRRPYLATSVPEFWGRNRWHISLNDWFRDYMYFPMGGSRVSKPRYYFNQMAVFVVSGLWHGANWTFVIWGALNGLYQIVTLLTAGVRHRVAAGLHVPKMLGSIVSGLVTFHLVTIAWAFFRAASVQDAFDILGRIAGTLPRLPTLLAVYPYSGEVILSFVLIGVLLVIEILDEKRGLWETLRTQPRVVRWGFYYALLIGLVVIGQWGLRQFVYMQF